MVQKTATVELLLDSRCKHTINHGLLHLGTKTKRLEAHCKSRKRVNLCSGLPLAVSKLGMKERKKERHRHRKRKVAHEGGEHM